MPQNIYDDAEFFGRYSQLPRSVAGLDAAPEWPTLRAMLPAVAGQRVVDLGCGFGWFCRWAAGAGAHSVLGIDLSENMLTRARADTPHASVTYRRHDLHHLDLGTDRFDVAYSSLTLHYLADLAPLLTEVRRVLPADGAFVFSVEHPIFTAPTVDRYLDEGPRTTDWLAPGVVKHHRTIARYVSLLRAAGFALAALDEWGPTDTQVAEHPEWAPDRHRPPFLLVSARAC